MNSTHRIAHILAPLALIGGIAAAVPAAHAAPTSHAAPSAQLHTGAGDTSQGSRISKDLSVTICVGKHCITIKF